MKKQTVQKKTQPKKLHERVFETDGVYFLKLVGIFLLGTFWIKFNDPVSINGFQLVAIPAGMLAGFIIVRAFEKHQADRKIWYALLVVIGVISNFQAAGIVI